MKMKRVMSIILSFILCFSVMCVVPNREVKAEDVYTFVMLNGQYINFNDTKPQIINGRALVPMRTIFEAMGATVVWDASTKTITANRGDITITMQIDSTKLYRNSTEINIDVPPVISGSSTIVPLRVIAECFNADVIWNDSLETVRKVYIFDYDSMNTNIGCFEKYSNVPDIGYFTRDQPADDNISDQVISNGVRTTYSYVTFYGSNANNILAVYRKILNKYGFYTSTGATAGKYDIYSDGEEVISIPKNIDYDSYNINHFDICVEYYDNIPYAS